MFELCWLSLEFSIIKSLRYSTNAGLQFWTGHKKKIIPTHSNKVPLKCCWNGSKSLRWQTKLNWHSLNCVSVSLTDIVFKKVYLWILGCERWHCNSSSENLKNNRHTQLHTPLKARLHERRCLSNTVKPTINTLSSCSSWPHRST